MLMNGFFAMSELAIVSARRARLIQIAEDTKSKGAKKALELADDPDSYLSVVQVGVTLNTILAGAFSGATMAESLGEVLDAVLWIAPYGTQAAFVITVGTVGYLTLIIGELVPKRIALAYAEPIAIHVASTMGVLAKIIAPFIWTLKLSTKLILKLIRLDKQKDQSITEEEVKTLIAEGTEKGVFKPAERNMLEGVMRLADWNVRTIMSPRIDMIWLGVEDEIQESLDVISKSGYSRFPVARGDMEEVLGVVYAKDLLNASLKDEQLNLTKIMRDPLIVPDTTAVLRLLDMFKESSKHLAIVIDEYGSVEGMVSVTDILEAITGTLPESGQDGDEEPVQREDGSWLLDAMMPIEEVENVISMKHMRDSEEYHTLAGFMLDEMGRIPTAGEYFMWNDARFEVVDMDGRRIDKVLVILPDNDKTDEI